MQDYSFEQVLAQIMANRLLTAVILGGVTALLFIALNWDKVRYFVMRLWHTVPLIGTVSRLAHQTKSDNGAIDKDGWLRSESALCEHYYPYYKSVDKDPEYFRKCEDYLAKVDESGRRTAPFWVVPLSVFLLALEAVGFAYVIGPFVNRNVSAEDLQLLTWSLACFLALISGFLAHIAGHQIHHNSLVKKARHWWAGSAPDSRDNQIGQLKPLSIDRTYEDDNQPLYNQVLARIRTNTDVTPSYGWVAGFGAVIVFIAIAAFMIRTEQLNALETERVAEMQTEMNAAAAASSPFDLPGESAQVAKDSIDQAAEDKVAAEHRASLVTFVVLSVVYVAIQFIALWISIVYGFAGRHSKAAYATTSMFDTADDMVRWMEQERMAVRAHADHKLHMLQHKISTFHMASSAAQQSQSTARHRDFLAYVEKRESEAMRTELAREARKQSGVAPAAPEVAQVAEAVEVPVAVPEAAPVVEALPPAAKVAQAPAVVEVPAAAQVPAGPNAAELDDLRGLEEEELVYLTDDFGLSFEQLKAIRAKQLTLAKLGRFPVKQGEPV